MLDVGKEDRHASCINGLLKSRLRAGARLQLLLRSSVRSSAGRRLRQNLVLSYGKKAYSTNTGALLKVFKQV